MVWYLHFLDALIEKKRTQHGLKHELDIFISRYRDFGVRALEFIQTGVVVGNVHVHKIVQSVGMFSGRCACH
jgi:hypothetical protein